MNEIATLDKFHQQHHAFSREALARAVWSLIAEPGDADAGRLIAESSAADAFDAVINVESVADLHTLRDRVLPRLSIPMVEMAFRAAARNGVELVTPEHAHWPSRLNGLGEAAPYALWVRGNTELLVEELATAVIGARAATGYGEHVAMEISAGLVGLGHTRVGCSLRNRRDGAPRRSRLAWPHRRLPCWGSGPVLSGWPRGPVDSDR